MRSSSTSSWSTRSTACKRADWDADLRRTSSSETEDEHNEVVDVGGLHIVGTERHEARRIDNQLRGRAGRQGDPGSSRFYLSLEDDLMRIFGSDRISGLMQRLGMEENVPIEHGMVTRAIERAQKQVEAQNFSVRKHLLEYDDVMNKQRESVYTLRREILEGKIHLSEDEVADTRGYVLATAEELLDDKVDQFAGKDIDEDDWDLDALQARPGAALRADRRRTSRRSASTTRAPASCATISGSESPAKYEEKEKIVPADLMRRVERDLMLQIVDAQWKDHLYSLDHLKEGIGLRGYGQRDPLVEYKKESFALFQDMRARIEEEIVRYLWWLRPVVEGEGGDAALPPVRTPRTPPRASTTAQLQRSERAAGALPARRRVSTAAGSQEHPATAPPTSAACRRRRCADQDGAARRAEDRPQRSVLVRLAARNSRNAMAPDMRAYVAAGRRSVRAGGSTGRVA